MRVERGRRDRAWSRVSVEGDGGHTAGRLFRRLFHIPRLCALAVLQLPARPVHAVRPSLESPLPAPLRPSGAVLSNEETPMRVCRLIITLALLCLAGLSPSAFAQTAMKM